MSPKEYEDIVVEKVRHKLENARLTIAALGASLEPLEVATLDVQLQLLDEVSVSINEAREWICRLDGAFDFQTHEERNGAT